MWETLDPAGEAAERAMRGQILSFLEEFCRGMTLQDARDWYVDAFACDGNVSN